MKQYLIQTFSLALQRPRKSIFGPLGHCIGSATFTISHDRRDANCMCCDRKTHRRLERGEGNELVHLKVQAVLCSFLLTEFLIQTPYHRLKAHSHVPCVWPAVSTHKSDARYGPEVGHRVNINRLGGSQISRGGSSQFQDRPQFGSRFRGLKNQCALWFPGWRWFLLCILWR